jgi:hypothetical protein
MTEHELGSAIRAALEQQGPTPAKPWNTRSVEARLSQLVPPAHQDLLPALSFLLRSRALDSALTQPSGSDNGRIASRLLAEVQAQFSPVICQRLQGVIQGLVGMAQPPSVSTAWAETPPAATPPSVTTVVKSSGAGAAWVVALLCFLIGIVGSGLVLLIWLQQQNNQSASGTAAPSAQHNTPTTPPAEPLPATPAPPSPAPTATLPSSPVGTDALNAAVGSIQALYAALSAKDYATAAKYYGPVAADQFDSTFFNQFERVTVANLHQTSNSGSMINFEGVMTFVYRNGDVQTETRTFTVDTSTTPALITSSEFGRVLRSR